ncbi:FxsA family protein [Paenibacillus algorifonticola]|uniref:FxsA family protein n=1 Tax=Paenibacillus algorifonticola TaxID=684063 RepID=UPI003D284A93
MKKWIIAALIILPLIEFWGIVQASSWLGGWQTFGLIVLFSMAGAYLTLAEGRKVWTEAQLQLQQGQIPGRKLLEGLCVLAGGLLLLIPGFFTDLIGITFLLPFTRSFYQQVMLHWLEKRIRGGSFSIRKF